MMCKQTFLIFSSIAITMSYGLDHQSAPSIVNNISLHSSFNSVFENHSYFTTGEGASEIGHLRRLILIRPWIRQKGNLAIGQNSGGDRGTVSRVASESRKISATPKAPTVETSVKDVSSGRDNSLSREENMLIEPQNKGERPSWYLTPDVTPGQPKGLKSVDTSEVKAVTATSTVTSDSLTDSSDSPSKLVITHQLNSTAPWMKIKTNTVSAPLKVGDKEGNNTKERIWISSSTPSDEYTYDIKFNVNVTFDSLELRLTLCMLCFVILFYFMYKCIFADISPPDQSSVPEPILIPMDLFEKKHSLF
uniref:PI-type proteinase n=1 Tax=Lygus hesperus TaxID=30085 RepID=A0A0A9XKA7_LYGHE